MVWTWSWRGGAGKDLGRPERKDALGFVALHGGGEARWVRRDYGTLAREGYMRNPVAHRAVRLVVEAAGAVPWVLYEGAAEVEGHPLLELLARPNGLQTGTAFLEALYGHLLIAGNAFAELIEAEVGYGRRGGE